MTVNADKWPGIGMLSTLSAPFTKSACSEGQ